MNGKLNIHKSTPLDSLGDMFGIFFEDINHAADGGLYAEMVQNRSFEYAPVDNPEYHSLYAWEKVEHADCKAELVIEETDPFHKNNPHYLVMSVMGSGKGAGIKNLGYNSGFAVESGCKYKFSCYARNNVKTPVTLTIRLEGDHGAIYGEQQIDVFKSDWKKYTGELTADKTDNSARLVLTLPPEASIALDFVSLFPEKTFLNRCNGLRADIAQFLMDMKPRFMRFPGGCVIHDGSLNNYDRDSMYRWKNSIGLVEERPVKRSNWRYNQSLGLGYFEYFQFCKDIGAKPLPVLPAGYDPHHQRMVPIDELEPWVQDALDLIEFANGDNTTRWGEIRSKLGHPEPFGLEYIGIGNEEVGEPFFKRYPYFHKAIREKYPDIKIINTAGPNAAGSEFERGWKCAKEQGSDLVDEHYYQAPEWFLANHYRYDEYSPEDPKVFLGEYATWGNTWYNALVEASYMIGLERNARVIGLACYAPMLVNVDYVNWRPNLIWFDNHRVFGTPNYYVQKLFMNHQGTFRLDIAAEGLEDPHIASEAITGQILLQGYKSKCKFSQVRIKNDDNGEEILLGEYVVEEGDEPTFAAVTYWENYTLSCTAEEITGERGFQIYFGWKDKENHFCWIIGGWQNYDMFLAHRIDGRNSDLSQGLFRVEKGRGYELSLHVKGRYITAAVDGEEHLMIEDKPVIIQPLYYTASVDEKDDSVIIKVVNLKQEDVSMEITLNGAIGRVNGQVFEMAYQPEEENSLDHPENVVPIEGEINVDGAQFPFTFKSMSFTILRLTDEVNLDRRNVLCGQ